MSTDRWTDPDPKPGDYAAELAKLDLRYVEHHDGDLEASLVVLVGVEGEDAKRLERLSARGKKAADVVAELLPDADRSVAEPRGPPLRQSSLKRQREVSSATGCNAPDALAPASRDEQQRARAAHRAVLRSFAKLERR